MSVEAVQQYLEDNEADVRIFRLSDSGATVDEAAATIGVAPDAIAKTLALHLGDGVIIIVMSGDAKIDNKKYREQFHQKAKMLSFEEVEPLTGHPVGGLCPFGLKSDYPVYLDVTIKGHAFIYPAAGSRYHAMKLSLQQMEQLTGAQWVDVCKKPEAAVQTA